MKTITTKNTNAAEVEAAAALEAVKAGTKSALEAAADIGGLTATPEAVHTTIATAAEAAAPASIRRAVLIAAADGNRYAVGKKALADTGVPAEESAAYASAVAMLYRAAVEYVDKLATPEAAIVPGKGQQSPLRKAECTLFQTWKIYLARVAGEAVKAAAADSTRLAAAFAVKPVRIAFAFESGVGKDGFPYTRPARGQSVALDGVASPAAFQRNVERLAAYRLCNVDGVMSLARAKEAAAASRARKEAAAAEYAASIMPAPETVEAAAEAPAAVREA